MIVLRRDKRVYVMGCGIICCLCLYYWILQNIQTIEPPKPDLLANNGEQTEESEELDGDGSIGEEETDLAESLIYMEDLARQRESLEQVKQEYRNGRDRLLARLEALAPSLDETRSEENEMLNAWNALNEQGDQITGFTETMVEDFISVRESKSSLTDSAATLAERHRLLQRLVQGVGGEEVGTSLNELSVRIDDLESSVDTHIRECREIAQQSQRLAQRAQESNRGETLQDLLWQMEVGKAAPELSRLAEERASEIADECDDYFDEMVAQTKRDAETRAQQRRTVNEQEAGTILQKAEDAMAIHESEQQRLDDEVEAKQRAVAFKRDRPRIEHYLVPFIALKRSYTTPSILDNEVKEFHWADIPLEQAASLSEIAETGVFESGADSFQRLERFTSSRVQMLNERYLPFGQPWSYRNEGYLILARELLMKHGQAMVDAELLRP